MQSVAFVLVCAVLMDDVRRPDGRILLRDVLAMNTQRSLTSASASGGDGYLLHSDQWCCYTCIHAKDIVPDS
jgi:hypothetical protein